jgi:pilus assembly protein FimV
MRRQFTVAFGLVGALASMSASALGLGTIRIDSRLNQPFAAEIPLLSVSAEQLETVRVRLADADEFRRLGIERADYLSELRFELLPGAAPVIRVSSARPARDPFLTFLLDVRTDTRRVLREYTVLLDPPPDAVSRGTAPAGPAPITAPAPLPLPPRAEAQPLPTPTSRPPATPLPVPESTPRPAVVVSEGLTPAADAPPAVSGRTALAMLHSVSCGWIGP